MNPTLKATLATTLLLLTSFTLIGCSNGTTENGILVDIHMVDYKGHPLTCLKEYQELTCDFVEYHEKYGNDN